ncbi:Na-translocating system protein MpsC family protein [Paramaledivibacter caminithermalis]|jgi:uncharacterized protein YbcI|uniref:Uncharacterized protein YbcI n=1 Tax=Paramaledivibacter caminithermalis (strain DSM 15212 / CIP 107654 / DViRD3) TaxID=1121301 RepID=A0A1M6P8I7_PARC5|nr:Na-translocating system protein MpsC family protein [Paramaledivibacter caminithermalis]SHK04220.1 Uncharacterized protein YbcI [Paramaledivibacter caminithermalis DSM 15212]
MGLMTLKAKRISLQNKLISFCSSLLKENFGKGPKNIKVKILEDIIEFNIEGYLVTLEKTLLKDSGDADFVIEIRKKWFKKNKEFIKNQIHNIVGKEVDFVYTSIKPIEDSIKIILIIK